MEAFKSFIVFAITIWIIYRVFSIIKYVKKGKK
jgi:uncharacterized membrane protein